MKLSPKRKADFQRLIMDYYEANKRASLPWRKKINPYRIWISEVMLQQTQVDRVVLFFENWMARFPTAHDLAAAPTIDVLKMWKGLGYNSRAIRLKNAAEILVKKYGGKFPKTLDEIMELPGIGPYTAGAVMSFAYDQKAVMIETNIRRVFINYFFKNSAEKIHDSEILNLVLQTLPEKNIREWYWALMDYGSHLGRELKRAGKKYNPNVKSRHYSKQSKFEGSDREIRSRILGILLDKKKDSLSGILKNVSDLSGDVDRVETIISKMEREGILEVKNGRINLKK
ncbi:MAG: A/G-specific adenine glycosylase [Patescibacteria group bacterium]|nr:A/G-specific adenine glycosylase [Patescibacteria group bacterium]